jgi:hypothetical protein
MEDYGEHHMGCPHIEIVPPVPLAGVSRFFTTNGRAYYSAATESVVIYDANVILKFDLKSDEVAHVERPAKWYFAGVEEDETGYRLRLYDSGSKHAERHVPFASADFRPGFGPVKRGVFPSAYGPWMQERSQA